MIENCGDGWKVYCGNCLDVMAAIPDNSIDSIVTDPPYGLSFMGKKWDYDVPSVEIWAECLRVLKPGGHLLAFAGTRTQHRMAVRIEDAGFEIRDMIAWVYGSGFPKSHNLKGDWQGWGTALKPALEPITVARKPLIGTVAENVLAHGTGALNVDGCRIGTTKDVPFSPKKVPASLHTVSMPGNTGTSGWDANIGRWPANLIHDGSEEVVGLFPEQNGVLGARREGGDKSIFSGGGHQQAEKQRIIGGVKDSGSAARFFYCAKASKRDRDEGLDEFEKKATAYGNQAQAELKRGNLDHSDGKSGMNKVKMRQNTHPTVKPTDLMRYLCRLVTPPGGTVFDPFMGSGSTGKAAAIEGFSFIGAEMQKEYFDIAVARISKKASKQQELI
jgi:site-specific DNA-methyltransferase (adenine-specific)